MERHGHLDFCLSPYAERSQDPQEFRNKDGASSQKLCWFTRSSSCSCEWSIPNVPETQLPGKIDSQVCTAYGRGISKGLRPGPLRAANAESPLGPAIHTIGATDSSSADPSKKARGLRRSGARW